MEERLHVAADMNNLHISAQLDEFNTRKYDVRLHVANMMELIISKRNVSERFAATTTSASRDTLCPLWSALGFNVRRLHPDARNQESGVDESIHAMIGQWTSRTYAPNVKPVLVLLTGDANFNHGGTTFLDVVQSAVLKGWTVEIYSFKRSCSSRFALFAESCTSVILQYLDDWRDAILFTQRRYFPSQSHSQPQYTNSNFNAPTSTDTRKKYKTLQCRNFARGFCRYGSECHFLHGNEAASTSTPAAAGDDDTNKCCICMVEDINCTIIPCGHTQLCVGCAGQLSDCPICRGPKESALRIYLNTN